MIIHIMIFRIMYKVKFYMEEKKVQIQEGKKQECIYRQTDKH